MRIYHVRIGMRLMVTFGGGLSSGRIGTVVNPAHYNHHRLSRDETGRYTPFDPKHEVMLMDDYGCLFTMFPQYLEAI